MTEQPDAEEQSRAPVLSPPKGLKWLLGRPGLVTAFAWGVAEGSVFFLIPDIIITLTALFSLKRSLLQMGCVVAGSLVAGIFLYQWSQVNYVAAKSMVLKVPFVRGSMFDETQREFQISGLWALYAGPTRGIPYKVYAVQAPAFCALPVFLLASIPARLERLAISWVVFACVGYVFRKRKARRWTAILFHGVYWIIVYVGYWTTI